VTGHGTESLLRSVQSGFGAHPAHYIMGAWGEGGLFTEVQRPWHETNHSLPSTVEVNANDDIDD
jgi:hypothetical protein